MVGLLQCSGRIIVAKWTAAHNVDTGLTFLPMVAQWLSGYGVVFYTERSLVRLRACPLLINNSGQTVHAYLPV